MFKRDVDIPRFDLRASDATDESQVTSQKSYNGSNTAGLTAAYRGLHWILYYKRAVVIKLQIIVAYSHGFLSSVTIENYLLLINLATIGFHNHLV